MIPSCELWKQNTVTISRNVSFYINLAHAHQQLFPLLTSSAQADECNLHPLEGRWDMSGHMTKVYCMATSLRLLGPRNLDLGFEIRLLAFNHKHLEIAPFLSLGTMKAATVDSLAIRIYRLQLPFLLHRSHPTSSHLRSGPKFSTILATDLDHHVALSYRISLKMGRDAHQGFESWHNSRLRRSPHRRIEGTGILSVGLFPSKAACQG